MSLHSNTRARRLLLGALLAVAGAGGIQGASAQTAQNFPIKPMRIILPYAAGGSTSAVARVFTQTMTETWGQQVLLDNRPGGNTVIGSEALVRSPADGHSLIMVTASHVINPHLASNLPYDAFRDFAPVSMVIRSNYLLAVNPKVPANNLKELIALARAQPGQLNSASVGSGGIQHLVNELFFLMADVKIQYVPYKGGGPVMTDLMGGQIQMTFSNLVNLLPHIRTGKIRAIAIAGDARAPAMPDLPTFAEAGLPGYEATNWFGMLAPAGTPADIIGKIGAEITRIQRLPDAIQQLANLGVEPYITTPAQFAAILKTDHARFGKVVKAANIKGSE